MKLSKINDYLHEKFSEFTNKNFIEDFNPYQIISKKKVCYTTSVVTNLRIQKLEQQSINLWALLEP